MSSKTLLEPTPKTFPPSTFSTLETRPIPYRGIRWGAPTEEEMREIHASRIREEMATEEPEFDPGA